MSRGPEQLRLTPDERANLVAYIDGELPDAISRVLSTKLTQSATARQEVEILKKTWELLGHLPLPQVDPQFSERTITEIRRLEVTSPDWEHRVRLLSTWALTLAIYVLLLGLGVGMGYGAVRWLWPDTSARLARDLSIAVHLDEYLEVGTFEFLKELAESPEFQGTTR
jgi:anti-sigma factor RsiW